MLNISGIIGKFIKNSSQRDIDKLKSIVKQINILEPEIKEIPDNKFSSKTIEFKSKIKNGAKLDESLLIAMKEVMEPPSDTELSATVISDLNHDDNYTAIDSTQNSNEEALMQLNDKNKNEDKKV